MAKPVYEIVNCDPDQESLQKALNDIAEREAEVISIVPDYRAVLGKAFGADRVFGFLIVVRGSA